MSRYIYDEVKQDFSETFKEVELKERIKINPIIIVDCMVRVTKDMGYDYPGQIPEEKLDIFKQDVETHLRACIRRIININRIYSSRKGV